MKMKDLLKISLLGLFSWPLFAGTMADMNTPSKFPFYIGAWGGYGVINGEYHQDGNVTQGRLTLGMAPKEYKNILFGAEVGFQSGTCASIVSHSKRRHCISIIAT